ncbi:MAG: FHA domain-containing protein [Deltaproteobacteria bacterium]|nr:FHA domain-containing protein [Deltaproteobacteria bacterium]MBI4197279.1 FHA domain-containing protein [Deltaproteobacteria bacterium]
MVQRELLSILACPRCKGRLEFEAGTEKLGCRSCQLSFPVREGIPTLLLEESQQLATGFEETQLFQASGAAGPAIQFQVVEGKNKGEVITLEKGCCRALGRSLNDTEKTRVFSSSPNISLDDVSKKVVMSYVSTQFHKERGAVVGEGEKLGAFERKGDVTLADSSISRLHAMIFYDDLGVGILDLVSKNGTFVNGAEVESRLLQKGDVVLLGSTKLKLE